MQPGVWSVRGAGDFVKTVICAFSVAHAANASAAIGKKNAGVKGIANIVHVGCLGRIALVCCGQVSLAVGKSTFPTSFRR